MQANDSNVAAYGRGLHDVGGVGARRARLAVVLAVVGCVWGYARFADPQPAAPSVVQFEGTGTFPGPQAYVANPGVGNEHIHVRSGPGAEFRIVETLNRGDPVTGIARAADTQGAFWIQLTGERRYVKESVLDLAAGTSP